MKLSWNEYRALLSRQLWVAPLSHLESLFDVEVTDLPVGFDKDLVQLIHRLSLPQPKLKALAPFVQKFIHRYIGMIREDLKEEASRTFLLEDNQMLRSAIKKYLQRYPNYLSLDGFNQCPDRVTYIGQEYSKYLWAFDDLLVPAINDGAHQSVIIELIDFMRQSTLFEREKRLIKAGDILQILYERRRVDVFHSVIKVGFNLEELLPSLIRRWRDKAEELSKQEIEMIKSCIKYSGRYRLYRINGWMDLYHHYPNLFIEIFLSLPMEDKQTLFLHLIKNKDNQLLRNILKEYPEFDLNFVSKKGETPFQIAIKYSNDEMFSLLPQYGARAFSRTDYYWRFIPYRLVDAGDFILPQVVIPTHFKEISYRRRLAHMFSVQGETVSGNVIESLEGAKPIQWLARYRPIIRNLHNIAFFKVKSQFKNWRALGHNAIWDILYHRIIEGLESLVHRKSMSQQMRIELFGTFTRITDDYLPQGHAQGIIETDKYIYHANRGYTTSSRSRRSGLMRFLKREKGWLTETFEYKISVTASIFEYFLETQLKYQDTFSLPEQTVGNCVHFTFEALVAGIVHVNLVELFETGQVPSRVAHSLSAKVAEQYLEAFNQADRSLLIREYLDFRLSLRPYAMSGTLDQRLISLVKGRIDQSHEAGKRQIEALDEIETHYKQEKLCQVESENFHPSFEAYSGNDFGLSFPFGQSVSCLSQQTPQTPRLVSGGVAVAGAMMSSTLMMTIGAVIGVGLAFYGAKRLAKRCRRRSIGGYRM